MASSAHSGDDVVCDINVTPLVDITLVLLIVFIVTAKIIAGQTLPLDLPKAQTGSEQQVVLAIELGADGALVANGKKLTSEDEILPIARDAHEKNPELRVVIDADEKVAHGRVVRVMDRAKEAGISRIAFGVQPGR